MSPVTASQAVKEMTRLEKTPAEKRAEWLMKRAGSPEYQSRSAILSLMIWRAQQIGERDLGDLIVRMEMAQGPKAAMKAMFSEPPLELMADHDPETAAENLIAEARENLFD